MIFSLITPSFAFTTSVPSIAPVYTSILSIFVLSNTALLLLFPFSIFIALFA
jgi:hypothetical protein